MNLPNGDVIRLWGDLDKRLAAWFQDLRSSDLAYLEYGFNFFIVSSHDYTSSNFPSKENRLSCVRIPIRSFFQ